MWQRELSAFFLFAAVAAVTPGPSNLLVLAAGARAGWRGGLPCLAGVVLGMALLMGAGVAGLGGLLRLVPWMLDALRWLGSAFLLWLAWKVATAPAMREDAHAQPVGFAKALLFQWINPKSWIVCASAAAGYGAVAEGSVPMRAAAMAGVFALAASLGCAVWLAFGAALHRRLREARWARRFNRIMGALLAASVLMVHL